MTHSTRTPLSSLSPETQLLVKTYFEYTMRSHGDTPDDRWLLRALSCNADQLEAWRQELRDNGHFVAGVRKWKPSNEVRAAVWDKTDGYCWYCKTKLHPFRTFTIDHVHPVSRGGADTIENLVPCCKSCNSRKGDR